jgi:hypothetical protein
MEMRKEVGHSVNPVQRQLGALAERLQLLARQIPVLLLNRSQIVENQGRLFAEYEVSL